MINSDPNMSRKQIFKELPLPVPRVSTVKLIGYIYKGIFIAIKLLLDIRLNIVKISEGKTINTRHKEIKRQTSLSKQLDKLSLDTNATVSKIPKEEKNETTENKN